MFIELRGHQVHTARFGSGEPTIVGISGAFGNWEIWQQPFELLSDRHRVIAYDHLGTGETRVADGAVTFDEQVEVVGALLDHFDVDGCVLAGDSNMVAVAVEAAVRWPERIGALVLAAGGVVHREDPLVQKFIHGLRTDFDRTVAGFVDFCIPEDGADHLKAWLRDIIGRTGGERAAVLLESFHGLDLSDRLPLVQAPTVVIHGEADVMPTASRADADLLAERIPDCRLEVLAGVGHVPTLTRPAEVAAIIERMAEAHSPS